MNPAALLLPRTAANAGYHRRIPDEVAGQLPGTIHYADLVADRRGSRVWRTGLHNGPMLAVKYTQPDLDDRDGVRPYAAELAAREAAVLQGMIGDNPGLVERGYLYGHGRTGGGSWIAVLWQQNPNLAQTWRRCERRPKQRDALMIQSALAAATALARLHRDGWYHGDLHAEHVLYLRGRARLIDYAWAQGPIDVCPTVPYRGGWGPVTPPEIAGQLLNTPAHHHVPLTSSGEVYTLAAVLHHLWTGQHARTLPGGDREPANLAGVYLAICAEDTLQPVDVEPVGLRHLLTEMLAHHPAARPSIDEVRDRLTFLAERL